MWIFSDIFSLAENQIRCQMQSLTMSANEIAYLFLLCYPVLDLRQSFSWNWPNNCTHRSRSETFCFGKIFDIPKVYWESCQNEKAFSSTKNVSTFSMYFTFLKDIFLQNLKELCLLSLLFIVLCSIQRIWLPLPRFSLIKNHQIHKTSRIYEMINNILLLDLKYSTIFFYWFSVEKDRTRWFDENLLHQMKHMSEHQ